MYLEIISLGFKTTCTVLKIVSKTTPNEKYHRKIAGILAFGFKKWITFICSSEISVLSFQDQDRNSFRSFIVLNIQKGFDNHSDAFIYLPVLLGTSMLCTFSYIYDMVLALVFHVALILDKLSNFPKYMKYLFNYFKFKKLRISCLKIEAL